MDLKITREETEWLQIPDRVSAVEVAKKLRLPAEGNILSDIDLELTPYIVDPVSLIGDNRVEWLVIIAPTQSGKTVILQTALADAIDQDPGDCLYVLPDETMGRKHMQKKIIDVIKTTPALAEHMTGRVRDLNKTGIQLDHMTIYPGWSGSLGSISSFPMKRVFLDEVRLMPLLKGAESNAIQLAEDRLTTYLDYGIAQGYMVSTPSIEGDLLHQQLDIKNTSVWFWQVPCPECGEYQPLDFFTNIKFNKKREQAECVCIHCGGIFYDEDKKKSWNNNGTYVRRILNSDGKWEDTKITPEGMAEYPFKVTKRMVFWWNSLVSPFRSFHRLWNKFIETKDKLHDYKNFVQCWEAKFWIDDISKTSTVKLRERRTSNLKREVPAGIKVITAGVDTQDNGFAVCVRGFGANKLTALIDEFFIDCNMNITTTEDIIAVFQRDIMGRIYLGEEKWKIALMAIDTGGHRTKEVYQAAANFSRILLVKGKNNQNTTYSYNKELNLYLVRTCEYLEETEERSTGNQFLLPKDVSADFLTQYCNIRKVKDMNRKTGEEKIIWKKTGRCDYRMADVHTFICIDIPCDLGILRYEIEKEGFKLNPYKKKTLVQDSARDNSNTSYDEQTFDFIGNYSNW